MKTATTFDHFLEPYNEIGHSEEESVDVQDFLKELTTGKYVYVASSLLS